jgi:alpha-tubulin suppressor-like RCC1 family protein
MPTFYNYRENGLTYSFDDVFVPAEPFRQGNLFTWGFNTTGAVGDNTGISRSTPVTTFAGGTNWKQVSNGYRFTAAVKTDGTLWTWGFNYQGVLGINLTGGSFAAGINGRTTPVTTFAGGNNWKQVSCGQYYMAAIKTDGTLWTWGRNEYGQLGNNTGTSRSTPVTTFAGGTNWKQVSCGMRHTSAIKTDGTLWTWGDNATGQVGNNTVTAFPNGVCTPVTTFAGGTNWQQVSCAYNHTTAIKTDGTLWVWGRNYAGSLGDNTIINRSTPVTTFAGGNNWKQVSGGGYYTAAIKTDGTLWTWGRNSIGQLGTNSQTNRSTPGTTFTGGSNWKQVSAADKHVLSIKTDGTLWVWGFANSGILGTNTANDTLNPVTTFAGGTNWKSVSDMCSSWNSAAITYIDDYQ